MKARFLALAIIAVLLMAFGTFAGACGDGGDGDGGGGGELTLQEYFEELQQLKQEYDQQADAVQAGAEEELQGVESVEEAADVLGSLLDDFLGIVTDSRDALNDLDAPAEVESLHSELVAVFDVAIVALEEVVDDVDNIESAADLQEVSSQVEGEFSGLGSQSKVVCFQLQDIAADNDITVDLRCGEEEE